MIPFFIRIFFVVVLLTACSPLPTTEQKTLIDQTETVQESSKQEDINEQKEIIELEKDENQYLSKVSPNIALLGLVVEGDDSIYYSYNNDECIYEVDKNGENKKKIIKANAINLFYYKGKLYFENFLEDKHKMVLCSVNKDGTEYKELADEVVNTFYVFNDIIYYKTGNYSMYAYDINKETNMLIKEPEVAGSVIYNSKLYYYDEGLYGNILEYDLVNKIEKFHPVFVSSYMQYHDENLYFNSLGWIEKYNINTEKVTQLFKDKLKYNQDYIATDFISVTDKYIFFIGRLINKEGALIEDGKALYRIEHDGSELTKIYENNVELFNILDDKIFVTNNYEYFKKKDGTYLNVIDFDGNELNWDI